MSRSVTDNRLCFLADYFDELAGLTREYQVLFYYGDRTVELNDTKTRRSFLKRCQCPNLSQDQFFVGARVVIFGRIMKLKAYGDEVTRQLCEKINDDTVVVVSERAFGKLGDVLSTVNVECGFSVRDMHTIVCNPKLVEEFGLPSSFANQRAQVLHLVRGGALEKGKDLAQRIGSAAYAAANHTEGSKLAGLIPYAMENPVALLGAEFVGISSVVVIKPHLVKSGDGGEVLQTLLNSGLSVAALSQFTLSTHHADAFLNAYKGILADYRDTVSHLSSGPVWVCQLVDQGVASATSSGAATLLRGVAKSASTKNVPNLVREVVGPFDPVIAKHLRPKTIRARHGADRVMNAVHCSDLVEDGEADAMYFWQELHAL
jgi:nucleoside-diphosphate kinase